MTVGFVTDPIHLEHASEGHPEGPERLQAVLALLEECGLVDRLEQIEPRDASDEELGWAHDPEYIETLRRASGEGGGWFDIDTYVVPRSFAAARRAAGACLAAVDAVLSQRVGSAFCAVRPPGHHASPERPMGFCLINNVSVAARYALRHHGLERTAIIDIDVHHGNGTQDAFYADPNVFYCSIHQYPFYPGTGSARKTGAGEAEGTNVNVPLPAGCGDAEYRAALDAVVEPAVRSFRPQLMLVSCGFDAHFADMLAGMSLSVAGYGELTRRLRTLADAVCDGRLVFVLEGGYDLTALPWGVRRALEVLLDEVPTPDPLGTLSDSRAPDIEPLLDELRSIHALPKAAHSPRLS